MYQFHLFLVGNRNPFYERISNRNHYYEKLFDQSIYIYTDIIYTAATKTTIVTYGFIEVSEIFSCWCVIGSGSEVQCLSNLLLLLLFPREESRFFFPACSVSLKTVSLSTLCKGTLPIFGRVCHGSVCWVLWWYGRS